MDPPVTPPPVTDVKTPGANPFVCSSVNEPAASDLRRLSRREYLSTLEMLTKGHVDLATLSDRINLLPADTVSDVFDSTDTSMTLDHIDAYLNIAREVSSTLVTKQAWLNTTLGCTSTMSESCWTKFLDGFAARVYRRPLTTTERTDLKALFTAENDFASGLTAVTMALLQSPNFIYKVEVGGTAANGNEKLLRMTDYEVASRLSFFATGRGPDAQLMDDARAGRLTNDTEFRTVAKRVLSSAEAKANVNEFYMQWLGANRLPASTHSDWFLAGLNRSQIGPESREELKDFTQDLTWTKPGTYKDLLVDETSYVKGSTLGAIYGGTASLPFRQRSGVLSRMAVLLSATNTTSLVHRGLMVRRNILCEKIPFPTITDENKDLFTPPKPDPLASLRKQIETRTSPVACQGCHAKLNPMGFVLENYDALGRYQTEEKVYDSQGNVLARHPIDARVYPNIDSPDEAPVNSLSQMAEAIAVSSKGPACAARQWFTFSESREPSSDDSCALKGLFDALISTDTMSASGDAPATLLNMFRSSAFQPGFKLRKIGP